MVVDVDLCAANGWCRDRDCLRPAQLAMHVEGEDLPHEYCAGCIVVRLGAHRAKGATVIYSDHARNLLRLSASSDPDTPEQIEADHPGWRVWRTRQGEEPVGWAATRRDPEAGVSRTVICESSEALRAALVDERALAAQSRQAKMVITR